MHNTKIFSIDNLFAALVVVMVLKFLPYIFTIDFLDPINNTVEDFNASDVVFSQFRDVKKVPPDTNIVLVNIGYLNRAGIAQQIEIINSYDPLVIGIDTFFRKLKNNSQDTALAVAMSKVKNLVLVSKLRYNAKIDKFDSLETSNPYFNQYASTGFSNLITDKTEEFRTTRAITPIESINNKTEEFFAVKLASYKNKVKADRFIARNNTKEIVNFRRNIDLGKYKTLDVKDVFSNKDNLGYLKGKIILLGFLGPDLETKVTEDIFFSPLNYNYIGKAYPDMYGMVVHANVISMILDEEYINTIPDLLKIALTFLIIYFNMALFRYIKHHFEFIYETANIFIITGEIILLNATMMYVFFWFNFEIGFSEATLYGIIFSATGFEIYHGTLKPLFKSTWDKMSLKKL
jgi:CHASE2 domain-containing sensor protein